MGEENWGKREWLERKRRREKEKRKIVAGNRIGLLFEINTD